MKKLILSAFAIFALTTANAQKSKKTQTNKETEETFNFKPTEGTITTEVGITGESLKTNFFNLVNNTAKFRYFIKDDLAVRAGLGLGSNKEEENEIPNPSNGNFSTTVSRYTNRTFTIGAEKHFAGSDRLSTYVGADIVLAFKGASTKTTNNYNGASTTIEGKGLGINASSSYGLRVTTGADYYFTKKLYLGVEVGLSYTMGTTDEVNTTVVAANGNTTTTITEAKGATSETSTNVIGGLKLGFQF